MSNFARVFNADVRVTGITFGGFGDPVFFAVDDSTLWLEDVSCLQSFAGLVLMSDSTLHASGLYFDQNNLGVMMNLISSSATIVNSQFDGISQLFDQPTLLVTDSTLFMENCTFNDITTSAVSGSSPIRIIQGSDVVAKGLRCEGNRMLPVSSCLFVSEESRVTVIDSVFIGNQGDLGYLYLLNSEAEIINSTMLDNSETGILSTQGGTFTMRGSTVVDNARVILSSGNGVIEDSVFIAPGSSPIAILNAVVEIRNVDVIGGSARYMNELS